MIKLKELWSIVYIFTISYLLDITIALHNNGISPFNKFSIDGRVASLPLFGLVIGSVLILLHCFLMTSIQKNGAKSQSKTSLPIPLVNDAYDHFAPSFKTRVFIIVSCFIFPVMLIINLWVQFNSDERSAWITDKERTPIGIYQPVNVTYFFNMNTHQYGARDSKKLCEDGADKSKASLSIPPCGVSYVPFWQPLIIFLLNCWALFYVWKIIQYEREFLLKIEIVEDKKISPPSRPSP